MEDEFRLVWTVRMLEDYLDKDYERVPKDELDAFAPTLAIVRAVGNNSRVLVALVSNEGYKAAEAMLQYDRDLSVIKL